MLRLLAGAQNLSSTPSLPLQINVFLVLLFSLISQLSFIIQQTQIDPSEFQLDINNLQINVVLKFETLIIVNWCMGQQQTKERGTINENYHIVKEISPGQYWIKPKKKNEELMLRIVSFYLEEEVVAFLKVLEKRKKIKNPHLLELIEFSRVFEQHMCSSTVKVKTITEHPFKTLQDDLLQRSRTSPQRYFSQDQLWSILYSCCHALYSLYINKISHEALSPNLIFIDTAGIIKIADGIVLGCVKNYLSLMNQQIQQKNVRYVSPELVNLIEDNNFYYYDKEKSDVYILAMITLEIGNLRPVPYFNAKSKTFDFNATLPALQEFKIRYTSKLADIIEKMLVQEAKDRWKFEQIIENIENRTIHMNSEVTQSNSSQKFNYEQLGKTVLFQKPKPITPNNPVFNNQSNGAMQKIKETTKIVQINFNNKPLTVMQRINEAPKIIPNNFQTQSFNHTNNNNPNVEPFRANPTFSIPNKYRQQNAQHLINTPIQNLYTNSMTKTDNIKKDNYLYFEPFKQFIEKKNFTMQNESHFPFNQAEKYIKKQGEANYSPYLHLAAYSNATSQPLSRLKQEDNQPISQTQINNYPFYSYKLEPNTFQHQRILKQHRFSELKFGGIQLNKLQQDKNLYTDRYNKIQQKVPQEEERSEKKDQNLNEKGQFVIQTGQNGKYEGFKYNNMKNGTGRIQYLDGGYYEGQWHDDCMEGYGKLYYPNNTIAYEGYWAQNQFNGTGKVYNEQPDLTSEAVDYRDFGKIGEKWLFYEGQFSHDSRHGRGMMKFANGDKFIGNFDKDIADGEGSFYCRNGDIVKGVWSKNKFVQII